MNYSACRSAMQLLLLLLLIVPVKKMNSPNQMAAPLIFLTLAGLILFSSAQSALCIRQLIGEDEISLLQNHSKHLSLPSEASALAGVWKDLLTLVNAHKGESKEAVALLRSYLAQFGYMNRNTVGGSNQFDFDDAVESAVKLYQQGFKLPITGVLDSSTLSMMIKPRCGREDVIDGVSLMIHQNHSSPSPTPTSSSSLKSGVKHFTFFPGGPRWLSKSSLTYAFASQNLNSIATLKEEEIRKAFAAGFSQWSTIIPLNFTEISSIEKADIKIEFLRLKHGDENPFDGPLGVLAHAFSPEDGRFHMDASEFWTVDMSENRQLSAIDLKSVVVHEIGHLIGLGHSQESEAIMYPSISPRQVKTVLREDDIDGAQSLYGVNPNYKPSITSSTTDGSSDTTTTTTSNAISNSNSILFPLFILAAMSLTRFL